MLKIIFCHTYLTETRLRAGLLIHAASWGAVTGHTLRVTLIAELAAITFFSRITFLAWTLTWPLPCKESGKMIQQESKRGLKQGSANYFCKRPESTYCRLFGQSLLQLFNSAHMA